MIKVNNPFVASNLVGGVAGNVVFVGTDGNFSQNNKFFWDDTNNKLRLGGATGVVLSSSVAGDLIMAGTGGVRNENLIFSFETAFGNLADRVSIYSTTGVANLFYEGNRTGASGFSMIGYGNGSSNYNIISIGGTPGSETASPSGQVLGNFNWFGWETTIRNQAQFTGITTEAWTSTARGTQLAFYVTPIGSTTRTLTFSIHGDGYLKIQTATGYIDLSTISAGNKNFKITATSDTPTDTWGAVTETFKVSAAPAGYLEIDVGGNARYIPFWT